MTNIDFLRGVSDYFAGREEADGSVVCPRHHIEHTGKVVYGAAIDLVLMKHGADGADRRERIRKRVLRTLTQVRTDPSTGASVFYPGSLDHRNAASNLIDSGACCDVLAEVLEEVPELFSAEERGALTTALRQVCDSYLVRAAIVKEVPAQRLWGATGLARVARLTGDKSYADAALEAVKRAIAQANDDASIPYFPEPERHNEHVGLADISTYYHSRHIGFIAYVYRCLGEEPDDAVKDFLRRALDFLCALYGRQGIKPLVNEAKQWYWESPYEVVSHSFDVHALVEGDRLFDEPRYRFFARLALERLYEHVEPDGGVVSHRGEEINFQCRDFWNGHVAWIARVVDQLPKPGVAEPPPVRLAVYENAGIVRVERGDYVAMLRGRKQPINISFGGDVGGGSFIYFGRRERGFDDEIGIPKWTSQAPGNYVVTPHDRPGFRQRVMSFYRDNRHDVRFRLYVANIERKAGNTKKAFEYPLRHVVNKLRDEMKGRYASHFDVAPSLSIDGDVLLFSSMLARRDGTVLRGSSLTRRYTFGEHEVSVEDCLTLDLPVRAVLYERIRSARDFVLETDAPQRTNGRSIMIQPKTFPTRIRTTYRL